MSTRNPEELHEMFRESDNSGDVDALVTLFEPDATLVSQPGKNVTGTEATGSSCRHRGG